MTTLEDASARVRQMIDEQQVPAELVGDVSLEQLLILVGVTVQDAIKSRTAAIEAANAEEAEDLLTKTMEDVAIRVGLTCIVAAIQELGGGSTSSDEADLELSLPPSSVAELMTSLLRGEGVTIRLNVGDES